MRPKGAINRNFAVDFPIRIIFNLPFSIFNLRKHASPSNLNSCVGESIFGSGSGAFGWEVAVPGVVDGEGAGLDQGLVTGVGGVVAQDGAELPLQSVVGACPGAALSQVGACDHGSLRVGIDKAVAHHGQRGGKAQVGCYGVE